jgi:putative hydrolase of the HAD superfamily
VLEVTPPTGWQQAWCDRLGIDEQEMLQRLGPIWRCGEVGTLSIEAIECLTAEALDLDEEGSAAFMEDLWSEYLGTLNHKMLGFAGLRPRFLTGIRSNGFVGARERERSAYGFEARCDVVLYSHEEGMKTPDPAFYRLACQRLSVSPENVLFVDDRADNVEEARQLGITSILFVTTEQAVAEIGVHLTEHPSIDPDGPCH